MSDHHELDPEQRARIDAAIEEQRHARRERTIEAFRRAQQAAEEEEARLAAVEAEKREAPPGGLNLPEPEDPSDLGELRLASEEASRTEALALREATRAEGDDLTFGSAEAEPRPDALQLGETSDPEVAPLEFGEASASALSDAPEEAQDLMSWLRGPIERTRDIIEERAAAASLQEEATGEEQPASVTPADEAPPERKPNRMLLAMRRVASASRRRLALFGAVALVALLVVAAVASASLLLPPEQLLASPTPTPVPSHSIEQADLRDMLLTSVDLPPEMAPRILASDDPLVVWLDELLPVSGGRGMVGLDWMADDPQLSDGLRQVYDLRLGFESEQAASAFLAAHAAQLAGPDKTQVPLSDAQAAGRADISYYANQTLSAARDGRRVTLLARCGTVAVALSVEADATFTQDRALALLDRALAVTGATQ